MSERARPARRRATRRAAALLAGLAALAAAACDRRAEVVEVRNIEIAQGFDETVFKPRMMAVELHNAPLPDMSREALAALIALPEGLVPAADGAVELPLVAPGGWARSEHGRIIRLALIFAPEEEIAGDALCDAREPLPSGAPESDSAYDVRMALCLRDTALASGSMHAEQGARLDDAFIARTLTELFRQVFGEGAEAETEAS